LGLVVAMGWSTGTGVEQCGVGAGASVSRMLSIHVTLAQSLSHIFVKVQMACECCTMMSRSFCVHLRRFWLKVSIFAKWGKGASLFSNVVVACGREEGADGGLSLRYCMLSLMVQFGSVELSGKGHSFFILALIASMSLSNLSSETTSLHDEGHG